MRSQGANRDGVVVSPAHDRATGSLDDRGPLRFGILGVDVHLTTDDDDLGRFFSHAYRLFPPDDGGARLDLEAVLHPASGRAFARAGETLVDLTKSPSPANHAFLMLLGAIMDAIDGSFMVHGAAVSDAGRGVILAGPAFAGKSTLVVELLRRGCAFLSDDAAPLERVGGRLLPFPRAVGLRKTESSPRPDASIPEEGLLELPHRWLVDPSALGAALLGAPVAPDFLFYLDPGGWSSGGESEPPVYEIALAHEPAKLRDELRIIGAISIEELPAHPFPGLVASFRASLGLAQGLVDLQRRHRESVLFLEQKRPPLMRSEGAPIVTPVPVSELLIPIVRDLLNRGDDGRLMRGLEGRVAPVLLEIGALLQRTRAYRVSSGSPGEVAGTIMNIVHEGVVR